MTFTTCLSTPTESLLFKMERFAQSRYPEKIAKPLAKIMTDLFINTPHFITACEGWGPTPCGDRIITSYEMHQKEFNDIGVNDYRVMMAIAEQFYKHIDFPGMSSWKKGDTWEMFDSLAIKT